MVFTIENSMKLNRKGLMMEELIEDELETLIMNTVEMYDPEDLEVEISTSF